MLAITLGDGKQVSIGAYVRAIKQVKATAPGTWFQESLQGRGMARREDILDQFYEMIRDHCNRGLVIRQANERRIWNEMKRRIKSECNWCGSNLGRYEPKHSRFCDASCSQAYRY